MGVSDEVRLASQAVISAPAESLADALNSFVRKFIGWPMAAVTDFVVDEEGHRTDAFASVIHAKSAPMQPSSGQGLPADTVAAVIDATADLDLEHLRATYSRIANAKRLKKKPAPRVADSPTTTVTLGIVLAQTTNLPLEHLGDEIDRLNAVTPGRERPDMVVIASTGVINYGVQLPGESVTGDFLPPGDGALEAFTPPMYIVMLARPLGGFSLNKMLAFLVGHLQFFSPATQSPPFNSILEGAPRHALTLTGYQFNLGGELVRVPRQFYNDRYLAPLPVRIDDDQGRALGLLRFLPWQDGGVVILEHSKLPLEGLLVFAGPEALQRGGVMRGKDSQLSYVLPMGRKDFGRMLDRLQKQSNMVIRPLQTEWVRQQVFADEGSSSPLLARLMIGMGHLRDAVFDHGNRGAFDDAYDPVLKSVLSARAALRQMTTLWREHERRVVTGEVARIDKNTLCIDESVDGAMRREAEAFINAAARVVKTGMQGLAAVLGVDIGFVFQKKGPFEAGLAALKGSDPALSSYLEQARAAWTECLLDVRNAVEHKGWTLPPVRYARVGDGIKAAEPSITGKPATEFAGFIFDRLACFVEEVTAHVLSRRFPPLMALAEIPLADRREEVPERFRLTLAHGGLVPWAVVYHHEPFEES